MTLDTRAARILLEHQFAELKARQTRVEHELSEPLNADSSERAVELENDQPLESQAALIARELASVGRALLRIDHGVYGQCVRCGDTIDLRRLEARPEAALCIGCARQES